MDAKSMPLAGECLQPGVEDAHLRELPALLPAASALSQAVLRSLDPVMARGIVDRVDTGRAFFQVDVQCTHPSEWTLYLVPRHAPAQRLAGGPGTRSSGELEVDLIESAGAFLAVAVAKITSEERLALAKVLAEGRGVVYVTVVFGPTTTWRMAAKLMVYGGKAEGLYAIGPALHQSPPERAH